MIALVDCNNFYASCERVFRPDLQGKPIVILSNNDGCIIARSDEAKALGIAMGAPEFQVRTQLQQHQVQVFSSNYALYGDMSQRVMAILRQFAPQVEEYSIDEAFLSFEGLHVEDYTALGLAIKQRIQQWVGIPVCIGFAPSKALAKLANRVAKKYKQRTGGVYHMATETQRLKALQWVQIEDIWGIGGRLSKKMKLRGIHTGLDFTRPEHTAYIKQTMGVVGLRLQLELQGLSVLDMEEPSVKKQIAVTRSFEGTLSDWDALRERVSTFAAVCGEKLRRQQSCCQHITVFIRKDKFQNETWPYAFYASEVLPFPSQSSLTLSQIAIRLLEKLYVPGQAYKKAGVLVGQLTPQHQRQFQLFGDEDPRHQALMQAMDACNSKYGDRKIRLGTHDLQRTWKMKQRHLSPKYTTDPNDLLVIQCR